jgi:hypothetical protein
MNLCSICLRFQLGRLETPLGFLAEAEAREQEVKNYLTGRINQLVAACQCAESRAGTLTAEVSNNLITLHICSTFYSNTVWFTL